MTKSHAKTETVAATVGRNVERLRTKANLTQKQLAVKCKLHRVTVAQIETARYASLRIESVQRLADALGSTVAALMAEPQKGAR